MDLIVFMNSTFALSPLLYKERKKDAKHNKKHCCLSLTALENVLNYGISGPELYSGDIV